MANALTQSQELPTAYGVSGGAHHNRLWLDLHASAWIAPASVPAYIVAQTIGGIAASGAKSEIDEAVAQAAINALFNK